MCSFQCTIPFHSIESKRTIQSLYNDFSNQFFCVCAIHSSVNRHVQFILENGQSTVKRINRKMNLYHAVHVVVLNCWPSLFFCRNRSVTHIEFQWTVQLNWIYLYKYSKLPKAIFNSIFVIPRTHNPHFPFIFHATLHVYSHVWLPCVCF